jgi:hypothetical protein
MPSERGAWDEAVLRIHSRAANGRLVVLGANLSGGWRD